MALTPAALFVRDVLDCECPADVLERVTVRRDLATIGGLPVRLALDVAGRLLVVVTECPGCGAVSAALAGIVREGRELRDAGGYRRFRFVVAASDPEVMRGALPPGLDAFPGADERLHLHVVDERDVASVDDRRPVA